ncbi:hypothetical protein GIB67_042858 [Kingdonia uniflora]|uniref:Leucine-rich repeat-containing N-terminal plant-type domain-containing protein n=1 Tax=Kingdonia uniflora TaxID=39325 RepID=A0A7J7NSI2_9MAGN|nr:hypothetical protein GIB67_042858 [Kingdonia uniflora]
MAITSYLITLFLLSLSLSSHSCLATCHVDDETGLLVFKLGIKSDPSGILSSWKRGTDCCTWNGVDCDATNKRVSSLSIYGQANDPNKYLSGTISTSLGKLVYLWGVYFLNTRNISGPFPKFLFSLPELRYVYIENNKLSGPLPINIGKLSGLQALSLEGNRFTGVIPSSILQLAQLTQLKLGKNLLSGPIPTGIGRLKNVTFLSLEHNQLSGKIPDVFSSFSDLMYLELSYNKLSGAIPLSISTLAPTLAFLKLGHNALTGNIPSYLGNFTKLDTLDLSSNFLTGIVPKTFKNLTKIFNLNLARNNFVDPFPEMFVRGIESLDLSYNNFNLIKIPKWVATSPIIYSLKLAGCGIKMRLDEFKPTKTYYYDYIDLSDNKISGSPITLLNRTDFLVGFWMSGNMLRFNMSSLIIPKMSQQLDLSRNLIIGNVPVSVVGLKKLNVSHNHLCGRLPVTKFPVEAFAWNDCLCGAPLIPCKF